MKRSSLVAIPLFLASSLQADTVREDRGLEERDIQALREWTNTKRQVTVKEIGGSLSISGQVRGEFQSTSEKMDILNPKTKKREFKEVRGLGENKPKESFDAEVNLMLDYRSDRTWASVKLEFDNDAGIFNGTSNKFRLERGVIGARVYRGNSYTVDMELGRRNLGVIFDSKLQFGSTFDGILVKYDHGFNEIGDVYLHAGAFVIDEKGSHFGYVGEFGYLNIMGTGFFTKYSLIDWDKEFKGSDSDTDIKIAKIKSREFDFTISQIIAGYRFTPSWLEKLVVVYMGGIVNHKAEKIALRGKNAEGVNVREIPIVEQTKSDVRLASKTTKGNGGFYAGFSVGQLRKQWDWATDFNYQFLGCQAVPGFDTAGIGLGNAEKREFYSVLSNRQEAATVENAVGNGNFHGVSLKATLLLTNNLVLEQSFSYSRRFDKDVCEKHRYRQYEMELIYNF